MILGWEDLLWNPTPVPQAGMPPVGLMPTAPLPAWEESPALSPKVAAEGRFIPNDKRSGSQPAAAYDPFKALGRSPEQPKPQPGALGESFGMLNPDDQQKWLEGQFATYEAGARRIKGLEDQIARAPSPYAKRGLDAILRTERAALPDINRLNEMKSGFAPLPTKTGLRTAAENVPRGFAESVLSLPEFAGIVKGYLGDQKVDDDSLLKWSQDAKKSVATMFPGDPARQNDFEQQLATGLGQLASFYGGGALTALAKAGPKAMAAVVALQGASASGSGGFEEATAKLKEARDEVAMTGDQAAVTELDRILQTFGYAAVGTTEALPVASTLGRFVSTPTSSLGRRALSGLESGLEEAAQEAGSQVAQNLIAQQTTDPNRGTGEGVTEGAAVGGILGTAFGALLPGRQRPAVYRGEPGEPLAFDDLVPTSEVPAQERTAEQPVTTATEVPAPEPTAASGEPQAIEPTTLQQDVPVAGVLMAATPKQQELTQTPIGELPLKQFNSSLSFQLPNKKVREAMITNAINMVQQAGSAAAALEQFSLPPGWELPYRQALDLINNFQQSQQASGQPTPVQKLEARQKLYEKYRGEVLSEIKEEVIAAGGLGYAHGAGSSALDKERLSGFAQLIAEDFIGYGPHKAQILASKPELQQWLEQRKGRLAELRQAYKTYDPAPLVQEKQSLTNQFGFAAPPGAGVTTPTSPNFGNPKTVVPTPALKSGDPIESASAAPTTDHSQPNIPGVKLPVAAVQDQKKLRTYINAFLASGRAVDLPREIVEPVLDVLGDLAHMLPGNTPAATLVRLEPAGFTESGQQLARGVFMTPDGQRRTQLATMEQLRSLRAFYDARGASRGLYFLIADPSEATSHLLTAKLWHEALHALRSQNLLPADNFSRLLGHAMDLRVLDLPYYEFAQAIKDPYAENYKTDATVSIAEFYAELYDGLPDIDERMAQEAVAHMLELYTSGTLTGQHVAPIKDVLDNIANGAYAQPPAQKTSTLNAPTSKKVPGYVAGTGTQAPAALQGAAASRAPDGRVDGGAAGQPRKLKPTEVRVYHGTVAPDFARFDAGQSEHDGDLYFTDSPELANQFAGTTDPAFMDYVQTSRPLGSAPRVIPADIDTAGFKKVNLGGYFRKYEYNKDDGAKLQAAVDQAKAEGYKGLIATGMTDLGATGTQYITWTPNTVTSALTGEEMYSGWFGGGKKKVPEKLTISEAKDWAVANLQGVAWDTFKGALANANSKGGNPSSSQYLNAVTHFLTFHAEHSSTLTTKQKKALKKLAAALEASADDQLLDETKSELAGLKKDLEKLAPLTKEMEDEFEFNPMDSNPALETLFNDLDAAAYSDAKAIMFALWKDFKKQFPGVGWTGASGSQEFKVVLKLALKDAAEGKSVHKIKPENAEALLKLSNDINVFGGSPSISTLTQAVGSHKEAMSKAVADNLAAMKAKHNIPDDTTVKPKPAKYPKVMDMIYAASASSQSLTNIVNSAWDQVKEQFPTLDEDSEAFKTYIAFALQVEAVGEKNELTAHKINLLAAGLFPDGKIPATPPAPAKKKYTELTKVGKSLGYTDTPAGKIFHNLWFKVYKEHGQPDSENSPEIKASMVTALKAAAALETDAMAQQLLDAADSIEVAEPKKAELAAPKQKLGGISFAEAKAMIDKAFPQGESYWYNQGIQHLKKDQGYTDKDIANNLPEAKTILANYYKATSSYLTEEGKQDLLAVAAALEGKAPAAAKVESGYKTPQEALEFIFQAVNDSKGTPDQQLWELVEKKYKGLWTQAYEAAGKPNSVNAPEVKQALVPMLANNSEEPMTKAKLKELGAKLAPKKLTPTEQVANAFNLISHPDAKVSAEKALKNLQKAAGIDVNAVDFDMLHGTPQFLKDLASDFVWWAEKDNLGSEAVAELEAAANMLSPEAALIAKENLAIDKGSIASTAKSIPTVKQTTAAKAAAPWPAVFGSADEASKFVFDHLSEEVKTAFTNAWVDVAKSHGQTSPEFVQPFVDKLNALANTMDNDVDNILVVKHLRSVAKRLAIPSAASKPLKVSFPEGLTFEDLIPAPARDYTFVKNAGGGSKPKELWKDAEGNEYLFKPVKASDEFIAYGEVLGGQISRLVNPGAPRIWAQELGGRLGSMQEMVANKGDLNGVDLNTLPKADIDALMREHVVDWLISNHDGHAKQFLRTEGGLIGIDKGQAFKYFGKDRLATDYHPNEQYGEQEPIYNELWRAFSEGKLTKYRDAVLGEQEENTKALKNAMAEIAAQYDKVRKRQMELADQVLAAEKASTAKVVEIFTSLRDFLPAIDDVDETWGQLKDKYADDDNKIDRVRADPAYQALRASLLSWIPNLLKAVAAQQDAPLRKQLDQVVEEFKTLNWNEDKWDLAEAVKDKVTPLAKAWNWPYNAKHAFSGIFKDADDAISATFNAHLYYDNYAQDDDTFLAPILERFEYLAANVNNVLNQLNGVHNPAAAEVKVLDGQLEELGENRRLLKDQLTEVEKDVDDLMYAAANKAIATLQEKLSDDDFKVMLRPYAEKRFKGREAGFNAFMDYALQRKHGLGAKFHRFFLELDRTRERLRQAAKASVGGQFFRDDHKSIAQAQYPETFGKLSPSEWTVLRNYTGGGYGETNRPMRDEKPLNSDGTINPGWRQAAALNNLIDAALKKLPPYVGTTWRGLSIHDEEKRRKQFVVGKIWKSPHVLSTSKNTEGGFGGKIKLVIEGKSGRAINQISYSSGEGEVLFPSDARFLITAIEETGNYEKYLRVQMVELSEVEFNELDKSFLQKLFGV